jgi:hypothetical protein
MNGNRVYVLRRHPDYFPPGLFLYGVGIFGLVPSWYSFFLFVADKSRADGGQRWNAECISCVARNPFLS